jgi:hypothetical protein
VAIAKAFISKAFLSIVNIKLVIYDFALATPAISGLAMTAYVTVAPDLIRGLIKVEGDAAILFSMTAFVITLLHVAT